MVTAMQRNLLRIPLRDSRHAMKPFTAKRRKLGRVLLAYERGLLTIESGRHLLRGRAHHAGDDDHSLRLGPSRTGAIVDPDLLDLLAMGRTMASAELIGTDLG